MRQDNYKNSRPEPSTRKGSGPLTTRHRLSRGGDRQLNRALHTVILHRRQHDQATKNYIARRVAEGKTTRDAVRLLKRYLARHLYRLLQNETHHSRLDKS
jgi:transposase